MPPQASIYLPLEDLRRFGVGEAELLSARPGKNFLGLMQFEGAHPLPV